MKRPTRGFTLIELMVVISIIAILSSVGIVTYTSSQKLARDSRRINDLNALSSALELYYQTNHRYPADQVCEGESPNPCLQKTSISFSNLKDSIESNWDISDEIHYLPIATSWMIGLVPDYLSTLPIDPINKHDNFFSSDDYFYSYKTNAYKGCPGEGQWYALMAQLETSNPKDVANKPVTWCDGTSVITGNSGGANVTFGGTPHYIGKIFGTTYLIVVSK